MGVGGGRGRFWVGRMGGWLGMLIRFIRCVFVAFFLFVGGVLLMKRVDQNCV